MEISTIHLTQTIISLDRALNRGPRGAPEASAPCWWVALSLAPGAPMAPPPFTNVGHSPWGQSRLSEPPPRLPPPHPLKRPLQGPVAGSRFDKAKAELAAGHMSHGPHPSEIKDPLPGPVLEE